MFRYVLPVLAALVLITASLIPDDAFARGRGGGGYRGGGGFHGGAARVGGVRGGAVHAGRVGRVGYAGYRGGYYPRRGYGAAAVGAAAVGAAAYGAYGAYGANNCYDAYGNYICSASIDTDTRRAHADGGWASPHRRPFLLNFAPRFNFKAA